MPMIAGSVDALGVGVGLAKEAFDIHRAKLPATIGPDALAGIADLFNSLATAFVAHIAANAKSTTVVTLPGLQTTTTAGAPTGPPAAPFPLTGSIA